jgi:hypothetical protein
MVLLAVITFLAGASYEAMGVAWVHYAERNKATPTAILSGMQALAQVAGIGESVRDWRLAPFYVVGWAFGSFLAVSWKVRRAGRHSKEKT